MQKLDKKYRIFLFKLTHLVVLVSFILGLIVPPEKAYAQSAVLPAPGTMIPPSVIFNEPVLKGLKVYPDNPLKFDFIVDSGEERLKDEALKEESTKLIKYFLAALTTPEEEMWVNLSPHEKDKIIPNEFGTTEMGRDLLAQDYLLKQLTASLIYPEESLGKEFWGKVYKKAQELYGIRHSSGNGETSPDSGNESGWATDISINTFNKVWIVPSKAVVYEKNGTVFVVNSHLKVMMEEDYVALRANQTQDTGHTTQGENGKSAGEIRDTRYKIRDARYDIRDTKYEIPDSSSQSSTISTEIIRELVLPEIEREVNEGRNFAQLRQIFNSFILAMWYKRNLKESLLGKVYVDKNRVKGITISDKDEKEKIYQRYLEAYKKGVYNYIKEEMDTRTQQMIPRKYFSGGVRFQLTSLGSAEMQEVHELGELSQGDRAVLAEDMANGPERLTSHTVLLAEDERAKGYVESAVRIANATEAEDPAVMVEGDLSELQFYELINDLHAGRVLSDYHLRLFGFESNEELFEWVQEQVLRHFEEVKFDYSNPTLSSELSIYYDDDLPYQVEVVEKFDKKERIKKTALLARRRLGGLVAPFAYQPVLIKDEQRVTKTPTGNKVYPLKMATVRLRVNPVSFDYLRKHGKEFIDMFLWSMREYSMRGLFDHNLLIDRFGVTDKGKVIVRNFESIEDAWDVFEAIPPQNVFESTFYLGVENLHNTRDQLYEISEELSRYFEEKLREEFDVNLLDRNKWNAGLIKSSEAELLAGELRQGVGRYLKAKNRITDHFVHPFLGVKITDFIVNMLKKRMEELPSRVLSENKDLLDVLASPSYLGQTALNEIQQKDPLYFSNLVAVISKNRELFDFLIAPDLIGVEALRFSAKTYLARESSLVDALHLLGEIKNFNSVFLEMTEILGIDALRANFMRNPLAFAFEIKALSGDVKSFEVMRLLASEDYIGKQVLNEVYREESWWFIRAVETLARNQESLAMFNLLKQSDYMGIDTLRESFRRWPYRVIMSCFLLMKNEGKFTAAYQSLQNTAIRQKTLRTAYLDSPYQLVFALILLGKEGVRQLTNYIYSDGKIDVNRLLQDANIKLGIDNYQVASVNATQGLIRILNVDPKYVEVAYSYEVDRNLAESRFKGLGYALTDHLTHSGDRRNFRFTDVLQGFDLGLNSGVRALPYSPYKFFLPEVATTAEKERLREMMRIGANRKVVVASSPSEKEMADIIQAYKNIEGEKPLLILGIRQPDVENILKEGLVRALPGVSIASRSADDQGKDIWVADGKTLDKVDVVILNTRGELLNLFKVANLAIVGEDRNLFEPTSQLVPVLYFSGPCGNNEIALKLLKKNGAAEQIDSFLLDQQIAAILSSPNKMVEGAQAAINEFREKMISSGRLIGSFLVAAAIFNDSTGVVEDQAMVVTLVDRIATAQQYADRNALQITRVITNYLWQHVKELNVSLAEVARIFGWEEPRDQEVFIQRILDNIHYDEFNFYHNFITAEWRRDIDDRYPPSVLALILQRIEESFLEVLDSPEFIETLIREQGVEESGATALRENNPFSINRPGWSAEENAAAFQSILALKVKEAEPVDNRLVDIQEEAAEAARLLQKQPLEITTAIKEYLLQKRGELEKELNDVVEFWGGSTSAAAGLLLNLVDARLNFDTKTVLSQNRRKNLPPYISSLIVSTIMDTLAGMIDPEEIWEYLITELQIDPFTVRRLKGKNPFTRHDFKPLEFIDIQPGQYSLSELRQIQAAVEEGRSLKELPFIRQEEVKSLDRHSGALSLPRLAEFQRSIRDGNQVDQARINFMIKYIRDNYESHESFSASEILEAFSRVGFLFNDRGDIDLSYVRSNLNTAVILGRLKKPAGHIDRWQIKRRYEDSSDFDALVAGQKDQIGLTIQNVAETNALREEIKSVPQMLSYLREAGGMAIDESGVRILDRMKFKLEVVQYLEAEAKWQENREMRLTAFSLLREALLDLGIIIADGQEEEFLVALGSVMLPLYRNNSQWENILRKVMAVYPEEGSKEVFSDQEIEVERARLVRKRPTAMRFLMGKDQKIEDPAMAVSEEEREFFARAVSKVKVGEEPPADPFRRRLIYSAERIRMRSSKGSDQAAAVLAFGKGNLRTVISISPSVIKTHQLKDDDVLVAVLKRDVNHPGYFLYLYKPEDFNFEYPEQSRNPLSLIYGVVGGENIKGEEVGKKFMPVDLAKLDILAFSVGDRNLFPAHRAYETNVTEINGGRAITIFQVLVNAKSWRGSFFGFPRDEVQRYNLTQRKDKPVVLEVKTDPDYGPYVEVGVKSDADYVPLRTHLWVQDSRTKNKNVSVDLNRLSLIDYVQDRTNIHGYLIAPRTYIHEGVISEAGEVIIKAELEIARGIEVDPMPLLAGKQAIFIPKPDADHGWIIQVHNYEAYKANKGRKPEYILIKNHAQNSLVNIEKEDGQSAEEFQVVVLQDQLAELTKQFEITPKNRLIVSQERPEDVLIKAAEIVDKLELELQRVRAKITPAMTRSLNAELQRRRLTGTELAGMTGVNINIISLISTGSYKRMVSRDLHARLAAALDIPLESLAPQRNSDLNLDQEYQLEQSLLLGRQLFGHLLWLTSKTYGFYASELGRQIHATKESLNAPMRGVGDPFSIEKIKVITNIIDVFVQKYSLRSIYASVNWHRQNQLDKEIVVKIGREIRERRKQKGFGELDDLAREVKIHAASLSKIEQGNSPSRSMETLGRIAQALDITLAELLSSVQQDMEEKDRLESDFSNKQKQAQQRLVQLLKERGIDPKQMDPANEQLRELITHSGLFLSNLKSFCNSKNKIFPEHLMALARGLGVEVGVLWDPEDLVEVRFAEAEVEASPGFLEAKKQIEKGTTRLESAAREAVANDHLSDEHIERLLWGQASRYVNPAEYERFLIETGLLDRLVNKVRLGIGITFDAHQQAILKLVMLFRLKQLYEIGEPLLVAELASGPYTLLAAWQQLAKGVEEGEPLLKEMLSDLVATAVDISPKMLESGERLKRELFPDIPVTSLHGGITDLKALGLQDNYYDVTTIGFGLEQLRTPQEKARALKEAHHVTKSGGLIVLIAPRYYFKAEFWERKDLLGWKVLVIPKAGDKADLLILEKTGPLPQPEVLEEFFLPVKDRETPKKVREEAAPLHVPEELEDEDRYEAMKDLGRFVEETASQIAALPAEDNRLYTLRSLRRRVAGLSKLIQQRMSIKGRNDIEKAKIAELESRITGRLIKLNAVLERLAGSMKSRELKDLNSILINFLEKKWTRQYIKKYPQVILPLEEFIKKMNDPDSAAALSVQEDPAMETDGEPPGLSKTAIDIEEVLAKNGVAAFPYIRSELEKANLRRLGQIAESLVKVGGLPIINFILQYLAETNDLWHEASYLMWAVDKIGLPLEETPELFFISRALVKVFLNHPEVSYQVYPLLVALKDRKYRFISYLSKQQLDWVVKKYIRQKSYERWLDYWRNFEVISELLFMLQEQSEIDLGLTGESMQKTLADILTEVNELESDHPDIDNVRRILIKFGGYWAIEVQEILLARLRGKMRSEDFQHLAKSLEISEVLEGLTVREPGWQALVRVKKAIQEAQRANPEFFIDFQTAGPDASVPKLNVAFSSQGKNWLRMVLGLRDEHFDPVLVLRTLVATQVSAFDDLVADIRTNTDLKQLGPHAYQQEILGRIMAKAYQEIEKQPFQEEIILGENRVSLTNEEVLQSLSAFIADHPEIKTGQNVSVNGWPISREQWDEFFILPGDHIKGDKGPLTELKPDGEDPAILTNDNNGKNGSLKDDSDKTVFLEQKHPVKVLSVELNPGDQVGHYEIIRQAGTGATANIYIAQDKEEANKKVVLKFFHPMFQQDEDMQKRIEAELAWYRAVRNSNDPKDKEYLPYSLEETAGYVAFPFFEEAQPLNEFIAANQDLPFEEKSEIAVELGIEIAQALQRLHRKEFGQVHRDIKPENILISRTEQGYQVRLLDLGLANTIGKPDLFSPRGVQGSPRFMAPEQIAAMLEETSFDETTDLYALGLILYYWLTGNIAFYEDEQDKTMFRAAPAGYLINRYKRMKNPEYRLPGLGLPLLSMAKATELEIAPTVLLNGKKTTQPVVPEGSPIAPKAEEEEYSEESLQIPLPLQIILGKLLAFERSQRYQSATEAVEVLMQFKEQEKLKEDPAMTVRDLPMEDLNNLRDRLKYLIDLRTKIKNDALPKMILFGDKHGQSEDLESILRVVERAAQSGERLVVVGHGDAFDRGSQNLRNWEILQRLKEISNQHANISVHFLMGNHDAVLIKGVLLDDEQALENWKREGGQAVLDEFNAHGRSVTELAFWMLKNFEFLYIDEWGLLHVHAGLKIYTDGEPDLLRPDLIRLGRQWDSLRLSWTKDSVEDPVIERETLNLLEQGTQLFEVRRISWSDHLQKEQIGIDQVNKDKLFDILRERAKENRRRAGKFVNERAIERLVASTWVGQVLKHEDRYRREGIEFQIISREPIADIKRIDYLLSKLGVYGVVFGHAHYERLFNLNNRILCIDVEDGDPGHVIFDRSGIRFRPLKRLLRTGDFVADKEKIVNNIDREIKSLFGRAVRTLRMSKKWSQKSLAEKLGLSVSIVRKWENAGEVARKSNRLYLSRIFNHDFEQYVDPASRISVELDPVKLTLGQYLKNLRELKGWSLEDARRALKIKSKSTILNWENDLNLPKKSMFVKLRAVYLEADFNRWEGDQEDASLVVSPRYRGSALPSEIIPVESVEKGGIDFNPRQGFELEIQRDGEGVPLPSNLENVENIKIDGFVPIIINVAPVHSLPLTLGMTDQDEIQLTQLSAAK